MDRLHPLPCSYQFSSIFVEIYESSKFFGLFVLLVHSYWVYITDDDGLSSLFPQCRFNNDQKRDSILYRRSLVNKYYPSSDFDRITYCSVDSIFVFMNRFQIWCQNIRIAHFQRFFRNVSFLYWYLRPLLLYLIVSLKSESNKKLPLLVYAHAGGFIYGGWNINNGAVCAIADSGVAVLYIDYVLCPEHAYPMQNNNAIDSLEVFHNK